MRMVIPANMDGTECSLCKEEMSFYGDRHSLENCFESLVKRVENLEAINLSLLVRIGRMESIEDIKRNA